MQRCSDPPLMSAPTSLGTPGGCRHHAHLIILVKPAPNFQMVYVTSAFRSTVLKIGISKHVGARHFSFLCLLCLHQPPAASLVVEYPSESAPPWSGEEGGELPPPPMGCFFGGLPLYLAETVLAPHMFVNSSAEPSLLVDWGCSPTAEGWSQTHSQPGWVPQVAGTQSQYVAVALCHGPGMVRPFCQGDRVHLKMGRSGYPFRECISHMGPKSVGSLEHQSPPLLLIIKE